MKVLTKDEKKLYESIVKFKKLKIKLQRAPKEFSEGY